MTEVGVHRFASGHHQHQRAEDQQRLAEPRLAEERQAEPRVERHRICGWRTICARPRIAMTTNQTTRTGPKTSDARAPLNWMANSPVSSPMVIGMT